MKITIRSFSYHHQGYPQEHSEHGGGFIFDCRGIENPGQIEKFKTLSGLDLETADWFEHQSHYFQFFESILELIICHLNSFQAKGYTEVTVSFGCTGGQHRSVFMAEKLKDYLNRDDSFKDQLEIQIEHTRSAAWPASCARTKKWSSSF